MARHLVRLKLALLRSGLATVGIRGKVAFGVAYVFAVCVGLFGAAGFVALRTADAEQFADFTPLLFGAVFLMWTFGPILTIASENTLDVDRLALFPLGPSSLMPGLLLGSMVGFGGLATLFTMAGAVVGTAPLSPAALVTAAAVAVQFAVCVAASRLLSTALSAFARKRRWRDIALTVVPLTFFVLQVALRFVPTDDGGGAVGVPGPVRTVSELLPSGPAAVAVVAVRQHRWAAAAAGLGLSVVMLGLLLRLWWLAIDRVLTTAVESGGSLRLGRERRQPGLFPRFTRWLPANRVGAVAAKELRLRWRDPRQRTGVIAAGFVGVVPVLSLRSAGGLSHAVVLAAVFPAVVLAMTAINAYGFDGPKYWIHVAAGEDPRADLTGKNIEAALIAGSLGVLSAVALAVVTGGWEYLAPTLALIAFALGLLLGIGNVTSVLMPVGLPDTSTNVWAANSTQGLQTLGPVLGVMFVAAVVLTPLVILSAAVVDQRPALSALVVAEWVGAVGVWRLGLGMAVRRSQGRQAELLAELSREGR